MNTETIYTIIIMASGLVTGFVGYFILEKYEWSKYMRSLRKQADKKAGKSTVNIIQ